MKVGMEVVGDKELISLFRDIAETIVPDALPGIAIESARIVEDSAKQKAPVITGQLRDSIVTEAESESQGIVSVEVGPTVDYADDVEFGGLRRVANPFMRSAIDENEEAVVNAVAQRLQTLLDGL